MRAQKGRGMRPFSRTRWFQRNSLNSFGMNGGDDGTRTRGLCRDRSSKEFLVKAGSGCEPPTGGFRFAFVASSDSIDSMATLTIRQLDEKTKTRLRVRAAQQATS